MKNKSGSFTGSTLGDLAIIAVVIIVIIIGIVVATSKNLGSMWSAIFP